MAYDSIVPANGLDVFENFIGYARRVLIEGRDQSAHQNRSPLWRVVFDSVSQVEIFDIVISPQMYPCASRLYDPTFRVPGRK